MEFQGKSKKSYEASMQAIGYSIAGMVILLIGIFNCLDMQIHCISINDHSITFENLYIMLYVIYVVAWTCV